MKLGTWLLAMMEPLVAKILLSLGLSVITITGVELVIGQLKTMVTANFSALPADMLSVFLLAGGGTGLGMIFGALTTKLLLWSIANTTRILGANPG